MQLGILYSSSKRTRNLENLIIKLRQNVVLIKVKCVKMISEESRKYAGLTIMQHESTSGDVSGGVARTYSHRGSWPPGDEFLIQQRFPG